MLLAGRRWQPRSLDRVVDTYRTSTRVSLIETDVGLAYVKGMGNPAGLGSLVSEVVCAELGGWYGLEVPDFAVVNVDDLEIPFDHGKRVLRGPAFASRKIEIRTADGTDYYLQRLRKPEALAKLVLFDTWVRNADRCPPLDALDPDPRYENLVFKPIPRGYDLVALDHTHCFTDGDLATDIGDPAITYDDRIYGFFPEFGPFIDDAGLHEAAARLSLIDDDFVSDVVRSVPREWGLTDAERQRLATTISERARHVSRNAPRLLASQIGLDFSEGGE